MDSNSLQELVESEGKEESISSRRQILLLLPTDHNKPLLQWNGPFKDEKCKGGSIYQIEINRKLKTFHTKLLKQFVERDGVQMTLTPGRRDFFLGGGGTREENRVGTKIEVQYVQKVTPWR